MHGYQCKMDASKDTLKVIDCILLEHVTDLSIHPYIKKIVI